MPFNSISNWKFASIHKIYLSGVKDGFSWKWAANIKLPVASCFLCNIHILHINVKELTNYSFSNFSMLLVKSMNSATESCSGRRVNKTASNSSIRGEKLFMLFLSILRR